MRPTLEAAVQLASELPATETFAEVSIAANQLEKDHQNDLGDETFVPEIPDGVLQVVNEKHSEDKEDDG